jgi:UDP-N-acetyl-D-mannosaminuronate dehydrogenase
LERFTPEYAIINSTVQPGTTNKIYEKVKIPIAYSPIRGKHTRMLEDIYHYTKYVSGVDKDTTNKAMEHFEKAGIKTKAFSTPTTLELANLMSTTYFGLLIAWAQEANRFCEKLNVDYDEVMSFTNEITYFPPVIFQPGYITGHCVMPNIEILKDVVDSDLLDTIEKSNEMKRKELLSKGESLEKRCAPKKREE